MLEFRNTKIQNNFNEIEIISQNFSYKSKGEGKYQESINQVPRLTQDTHWENERTQEISHIGEARDHPFPIRQWLEVRIRTPSLGG